MAGITAAGVYIPNYRLQAEEIARMWGTGGGWGEKAVAGYDEDAVTMAVAAIGECTKGVKIDVGGLNFASTTASYREKQSAAIIAGAAGLNAACATADFAHSLRSGTTALKSALDAVNGNSAEQVLVAASDCRTGEPKSPFEGQFGDGAAALVVGAKDVIAEIEAVYSVFSEFTGLWRREGDRFVKSGEGRFVNEAGVLPVMKNTVNGLMKAHGFKPDDFSKVVLVASDASQHSKMARNLGFDPERIQDPLFSRIGHTGTASALILLVAALEEAEPGDRILLANSGDGADAICFRVTEAIADAGRRPMLESRLKNGRPIDYGTYLNWRNLMPIAAPVLPPKGEPSLSARWRQRKVIATLTGVQCRQCGLPQIHTIGQNIRVCVQCQARDDFDEYRFSNRKASLFTYSIDHLQPTKNPPGVNGVVDFEGGGRLICELTDCDPGRVEIGMRLEMTFRKMTDGDGIVNYFWKAKPLT